MKKRFLQFRMTTMAVMIGLLLGMAGNVFAYDFSAVCETGQTLYYSITDATNHYVEMVAPNGNGPFGWNNYTRPTGDIILPESVQNDGATYTVTAIGIYAFFDCFGLTGNLTIPNSVTTIKACAFGYCSGFTGSLSIPNSVISIGNGAFYACSGFIGSLSIPNSVITIDEEAFRGCNGFTGDLIINNSVTTIGFGAFCNCSGFTGDLIIGNSVTTIGALAFNYCNGFTGSLIIGNSVITIEERAFENCTGFTGSLIIGNSVTTIGEMAFENCSGFSGNLDIPQSVTTIGSRAFYDCSGFSGNLTIPDSVTTIGGWAFYNCSGFSDSLVIPTSVIEIGNDAFTGTVWYNNQPNGILYLSECCLGYKGNQPVGLLNIQEGTRLICSAAFHGCRNLRGNLTIPNSVTIIGGNAFAYCTGFTGDLIIPNSVTSLGGFAFYGCSGFHGNLIISNSVTSLGDYAFSCIGSSSVTIGNSVASIGSSAFEGCNNLASMTIFAETPPTLTIGYDGIIFVFSDVDKSIPVYVPYGTMAAYQAAPGWNEFTNYQEMPPVNTTQTVELAAGWNWFSTNVDITLEDLQNALVDAAPNTNITIKSSTQNIAYNPGTNQWRGTLDSLDVSQMYMIQVGADCQITLTGTSINPNACPITIHNGNNWIAFPLSESMSISDAFSGFATNGDILKSRTTTARYNNGNWRGGLDSLEPGQGYIYKSNVTETRTFTFPTSTK